MAASRYFYLMQMINISFVRKCIQHCKPKDTNRGGDFVLANQRLSIFSDESSKLLDGNGIRFISC